MYHHVTFGFADKLYSGLSVFDDVLKITNENKGYTRLSDYINEHTIVGQLNLINFQYFFISYISIVLIISLAFLLDHLGVF